MSSKSNFKISYKDLDNVFKLKFSEPKEGETGLELRYEQSRDKADQVGYDTGFKINGLDIRHMFMAKAWPGFHNQSITKTASCPGCTTGEGESVTLPAGTIHSWDSQNDADSRAATEAYDRAVEKLCCGFYNDVMTVTMSCPGDDSVVRKITIESGKYRSDISVEDANEKAEHEALAMLSIGMDCQFYNQRPYYLRGYCPEGTTSDGETIRTIVHKQTVTSSISEDHAYTLAVELAESNIQDLIKTKCRPVNCSQPVSGTVRCSSGRTFPDGSTTQFISLDYCAFSGDESVTVLTQQAKSQLIAMRAELLTECTTTTFWNQVTTFVMTCPGEMKDELNYHTADITVTVPAGSASSTVSQGEADQAAHQMAKDFFTTLSLSRCIIRNSYLEVEAVCAEGLSGGSQKFIYEEGAEYQTLYSLGNWLNEDGEVCTSDSAQACIDYVRLGMLEDQAQNWKIKNCTNSTYCNNERIFQVSPAHGYEGPTGNIFVAAETYCYEEGDECDSPDSCQDLADINALSHGLLLVNEYKDENHTEIFVEQDLERTRVIYCNDGSVDGIEHVLTVEPYTYELTLLEAEALSGRVFEDTNDVEGYIEELIEADLDIQESSVMEDCDCTYFRNNRVIQQGNCDHLSSYMVDPTVDYNLVVKAGTLVEPYTALGIDYCDITWGTDIMTTKAIDLLGDLMEEYREEACIKTYQNSRSALAYYCLPSSGCTSGGSVKAWVFEKGAITIPETACNSNDSECTQAVRETQLIAYRYIHNILAPEATCDELESGNCVGPFFVTEEDVDDLSSIPVWYDSGSYPPNDWDDLPSDALDQSTPPVPGYDSKYVTRVDV